MSLPARLKVFKLTDLGDVDVKEKAKFSRLWDIVDEKSKRWWVDAMMRIDARELCEEEF